MDLRGGLFGAATQHNHKNSDNKSNKKTMNRNWSNQKANPALKTKMGNNKKSQINTVSKEMESMDRKMATDCKQPPEDWKIKSI